MEKSLEIFIEPIEKPKPHAGFDEHMEYIAKSRRLTERYIAARCKEVCESPIEELLFLHLWFHATDGTYDMRFTPQYQIGKYRVDFMVEIECRKLVVECDGHEFHEKTKEQAKRDKTRDRYLTSRGYTVLHFTGSEISENPMKVVDEINDVVYSEMVRQDLGLRNGR